MREKVTIEIMSDGTVKVEAMGFVGQKCVKDLIWLDEILGKAKSRIFKDDYRKVEGVKIYG